MEFSVFRDDFQTWLTRFVREHVEKFQHTAQDPFLNTAAAHIERIVEGGKRIRPYLAQVGYAAGGGEDRGTLFRFGVGLELFHVFCLVHDDVIDKAMSRRGVPTLEAFVLSQLEAQSRRGDLVHMSRSHALLLGDLIFSWAMREASAAALASSCPNLVLAELYDMIDEVVVGQMIDVDTMTRDEQDEAMLERKMHLKTAGYSFVRPLRLGLLLSGHATDAGLEAMSDIGVSLGLAFQLQDDVLDIVSTEDVLGKPTLSDIRDGQQTVLTAYVARHGSDDDRALLQRVMQGQGSEQDAMALRDVLREGGALEAAVQRIDGHFSAAERAIDHAPFSEDTRRALRAVITALDARVK